MTIVKGVLSYAKYFLGTHKTTLNNGKRDHYNAFGQIEKFSI